MLSLILGVIFGNITFDVVNNLFDADSDIWYWAIIIVFVIFFIYLKTKLEDYVIIVVTSLLGSYMVVRAFTIFKPEFPDEGYIAALYHHKEIQTISRVVNQDMLTYILAFAILFIIGLIVQISNYKPDEKEGEEKENDNKEDKKEEDKKENNDNKVDVNENEVKAENTDNENENKVDKKDE